MLAAPLEYLCDQWDLHEADKRLVKEHIFAQDYAESPEQLNTLAQTHWFTKTECWFFSLWRE